MYTPTYIFGVPAVQANGAAAQPAEQTNRAGPEVEVGAARAVDDGDVQRPGASQATPDGFVCVHTYATR